MLHFLQWDLVCGNKHYASLATTIYFTGVMLGGLLFGFVSDCIGRLPVILFTLYTAVVIGTGLSFVPNYSLFVILRFVIGVLMQVCYGFCIFLFNSFPKISYSN